jgi:hypothetical protein
MGLGVRVKMPALLFALPPKSTLIDLQAMRFISLMNIFIFLLASFSICFGESDSPFLVRVESLEREVSLLSFPAKPGDRFHIHYTHSSDKTPVHDIFEIGPRGEMVLIEEIFSWYGAGLEFMDWEKASVIQEDGRTRVRLRRPFPFLLLRVGRVANHQITFNGTTLSLREIARGGELLKIWVEPRDSP